MKSVMHIIESLEFGGAEKVVVQIANNISDDFKTSVCLVRRTGELVDELNNKVDIHKLYVPDGINPFGIIRLARLFLANKPDIVHIHNWGIYLSAVIAAVVTGRPRIIVTIHGPYITYGLGFSQKLKMNLRHFLESKLSRFVYRFIPVSSSIIDYMINDIGVDRSHISVIHNGVGESDIQRNTSLNESENLKLITVGRLAKIKNHEFMINALSKTKNISKISLTIVGDGPEMSNLIKLAEDIGVIDKINFLGFQSDIRSILSKHDVFLISSDYEGISIAVLEAMSVGLPVVATNVGGLPETIIDHETGFLVEKGDIVKYSMLIDQLFNDRNLVNDSGCRSLDLFKQRFSENVVLNQYLEIYKS